MSFATLAAAFLVLAADRLTKVVFYNMLNARRMVEVFPPFFRLTLVLNKGIAFGFLRDRLDILVPVTLIILAFMLVYIYRARPQGFLSRVSLGMILGGALGNLFDRLKFGCVIDFLDFRVWPVFNVADSSITIGAFLLAAGILFAGKKQSRCA